jgi:hypothetical protein
VPIGVRGKYVYALLIWKTFGQPFHLAGISPGDASLLENARNAWPDSSGYTPILIDNGANLYLHFPQIDDHNLMMLRRGFKIPDSVSIAFTESTGDNNTAYISPMIKNGTFKKDSLPGVAYLSDSRRIFKYLILRDLQQKRKNTKALQ